VAHNNPAAAPLLAWYDRHRRTMPWRARPGEVADPYRVWLSEIMLQQTTVAAVIPYHGRFLTRFPTVRSLAAADGAEVMAAWAGLGYYARARNLHACAKAVAASGGVFPSTVEGLQALPGIGRYTARAVAAIAFGVPVVPVDGNVERVVSRLYAIIRPALVPAAADALGRDPDAVARPSDFVQALFDLGATICTPRNPACAICPWSAVCAGRMAGVAETLPVKAVKRERPLRHGAAFWLTDDAGRVLLRTRPPTGLLGGMPELPGTPWRETPWTAPEAVTHAPADAEWHRAGQVRHGFTHFELHLEVFRAQVDGLPDGGFAHPAAELGVLPTVMRKCAELARR